MVNKKVHSWEFPGGSVVQNQPSNAGGTGSIPGQEDLLKKEMVMYPSILDLDRLVDYNLWGRKESDMTG